VDFITNCFNPDYEYDSKHKEIESRDFRVQKPKMSDINARYDEFKNFEQSPSYRNTKIATNLLSSKFEVNASDLTDTLIQKYGLSHSDCDEVLKNMANSKDVDMRTGTFDKVVKLKRR
jgi:hypothetical protein